MKVDKSLLQRIDAWRRNPGPQQHVVISSRVRYARNIENVRFPPRATDEELRQVCELVANVRDNLREFADYQMIDLSRLSPLERAYLKESQIISRELESGKKFRHVYFNSESSTVILLNEEDHIRAYSLQTGFQLYPLLGRMDQLDEQLGASLSYAFHEQFGYLTACPTNTGTGIRGSVMLHLPALVISEKVNEALSDIPRQGMTVRGFYGENSDHSGDCYQVSNETTLGRSETEIIELLTSIIEGIIHKEVAARKALYEKNPLVIEDLVARTYGSLRFGRQFNTDECMRNLSRIRLGIDLGLLKGLSHVELNRLMVRIQPAHLQLEHKTESTAEKRDALRAEIVRSVFNKVECLN